MPSDNCLSTKKTKNEREAGLYQKEKRKGKKIAKRKILESMFCCKSFLRPACKKILSLPKNRVQKKKIVQKPQSFYVSFVTTKK